MGVWQVLPSVGDKNAFAGICSLSEYFPSSYYCVSVAGVNASRDIMRMVATLMVLFRLFGWSRTATFARCSLLSALRAVERKDVDAVMLLSSTQPFSVLRAAAAARFCLQVCKLGPLNKYLISSFFPSAFSPPLPRSDRLWSGRPNAP